MSRRPAHIEKRKPFPKAVRLAVLYRSQGMCEADGCDAVGKDFDHKKAVAVGGQSTLENCRLLCRDCNAADGVVVAKAAAKSDRQGGRSGQYARRKKNGSKLQSRGFQKSATHKRQVGGNVVARKG